MPGPAELEVWTLLEAVMVTPDKETQFPHL